MQLTILDIIIKTTLVLGIAAAAAAALRRASASTRHFVWTLGMLGALSAPLVSFAVPRWELPIVQLETDAPQAPAAAIAPIHEGQTATALRAGSDVGRAGAATRGGLTPATAMTGSEPGRWATHFASWATTSWTMLLFVAWAVGALVILGRVLLGLVAVQVMTRRTPAPADATWLPLANELASELGLHRVRFMRAASASMPMAWGIFRPSVLMPADADTWPADRLRIVLLHELAHVKRRDCLTHVCSQVAFAAYWFNPLAWIAARRMRAERERACDDLVLAAGTRGSDYADQLLDIARVMRGGRFPAVLAGASLAMAHRSQLEGRLMAILDPTIRRGAPGRVSAALAVVAFAILVVPVAAVQPWTENAQSGTRPQTPDAPIVVREQTKTVDKQVATETHRSVVVKPRHDATAEGVAGGVAGGIVEGVVGGVPEGVAAGVVGGITEAVASVAESVQTAVAKEKTVEKEKEKGVAQESKTPRDPRTINALIEALKDSDKGVRETAMAALSHTRDPRMFDPFVVALRDGDPEVRERAAFGLGQLRDKRAVAPLSQALKDENRDVREQAVFALGQLRAADAIDGLTIALRDSSKDVREQAAFALGQIRDPRAIDPLTSALKDENVDVREQAAFALGQLRDAKAVDVLVIALKDANPSVREQAAFALGQIRDARAIDGLTMALKDPNPSVRQQAAFALGQIR